MRLGLAPWDGPNYCKHMMSPHNISLSLAMSRPQVPTVACAAKVCKWRLHAYPHTWSIVTRCARAACWYCSSAASRSWSSI
jgi:hypothetical protein